jgi:hypothetical protein
MIAPSARDDIAGHPYTRQKPRKLRFLMTDNNSDHGEFHGGYGWPDLRKLITRCGD